MMVVWILDTICQCVFVADKLWEENSEIEKVSL